MTTKKQHNRFNAINSLINKLQQKLSKKQVQLEENFAKRDDLRLEEHFYEQGQVNSTALAKRRMRERHGFSRVEAQYRSNQIDFGNEISNNLPSQPSYYKQNAWPNKQVAGKRQAQEQIISKKSGLKAWLHGLKSNFARITVKHKKLVQSQPQSLLHAAQNPQRNQMPAPKQSLQERLLQFVYIVIGIFMRPQKLDLNKVDNLNVSTVGIVNANKRKIENINEQLDTTIKKLQKQEKQRRTIAAFCFSISLLLLALVICKVILNQTGHKLQLQILKNGNLEQQFPAFGFVAREERVLYSPVAGEIEAIKAEGSLVAADQEIANIVTSDISDIKRKNDNIEQQISERILTLLKQGKNMQANQLFVKADTEMLPTLNLLRRDLTENKLGHLNNYMYTLQPFMQERNFSLKQMNLADPIIDNLHTEQKVLVRELQEKARIIETPTSGLISYKINPQLVDINTETIQSMSYDQFINYYNSAKPSVSSNGKKVKEKVPVIRLVDTRYQYFLLQVASAKSSDFTVGKHYKLKVDGVGQTIDNCTVLRVTPDAGGVLLLLKCDRNVEVLLDQVALKAQIIKVTRSGLVVPKVALVYEDINRESTAYIELLKGGFVEKESVRVLDSNEQYAIIEGLNAKDTNIAESAIIILNPRQVKIGQQVT